ncbi:MAG: HI0074 family nucleotidyltransferase substrate-binding subunit [Thermodesulfobacteriota bacterium]|jgi:nucleotidyltransferase substrate binding protein (TIGR01987 family)|nr:HI0074 family nucleotidyltransferase substrate-binding subunit [Thermodesulfobacteriota bacterium]
MKLDISPFEKALSQLERSLEYLHSDLAESDDGLREQFRAATIQAFEFSYELGTKMLRRQLEQITPNPAEIRSLAFMDMVRTGAEAGLVRQVPQYRIFREKRNMTSHTYDEAKAEEVLAVLDDFVTEMHFLRDELKRRNG